MQAETGAVITIEEQGDQGRVEIAANNKAAIDAAIAKIKGIVAIPEIGETYPSKVKSVMPYGAFVEFMRVKKVCFISPKSTGNVSKRWIRPESRKVI